MNVQDWLAKREQQMIGLTRDLVDIDSNSNDKEGVIRVFDRLEQFFAEHGIGVQWHSHEGVRNAISVEVPARQAPAGASGTGAGNHAVRDSVLLMGHCDTVHPTGEVSVRPFSIQGNRAYGPGVADMKAGVAMNAFIIAAYHQAGGASLPVLGLFTNDEEVGSPTSCHVIESFARRAKYVFNAEPGRPGGEVVTQRKGGVFLDISVTGKAAHAGANFTDGVSAINEIASKVARLTALTDLDAGVTVNVGLIAGGLSVNTVAPSARCEVDLRISNLADRDRMVAEIEAIAKDNTIAGTESSMRIFGEFRPLEKSPHSIALFEHYQKVAKSLGHDIDEQASGGCADSGITSSLGCATVCATGPVGGKPHTKEEYIELDSFVPRAQFVALAIERL